MDLAKLRREIDEKNLEIVDIICKRLKIAENIAIIKQKENLPIPNEDREQEIYKKMGELAEEKGVDPKFIKNIFKNIIEYTKEFEKGVK